MSRIATYDKQQLADILRRQRHVIGRDQALACGLTPAAVQHRIRPGGPWHRLLPGVYVALTGPVVPEQREMAALVHAGPRSVLTGLAAARRHGFLIPEAGPIDVLVPPQVRRRSTGFVRVQQSTRMPGEVRVAGEVRYVRAERAVADAARSMTVATDVRALVAQAIQLRRCSIQLLAMELEQGPRHGSALLRAALEEVRAGVRSVPEGDLRGLIRRGKIPVPVFNARLYAGKTLLAVVDAWWEEAGVGAEVDSKEYHYSAGDWQRTMVRHDRLIAQGVLLLHFTPRQIRTEPGRVAAQIRAALAAGRGRRRLMITTRPPG
jgi:hypothetical protein